MLIWIWQLRLFLQILLLSNNAIAHVQGDAFQNTTVLKQLGLRNNQLKIPPPLTDICATLVILDISHNKITSITDGYFARCSALKQLFMNSNKLLVIDANMFAETRVLELVNSAVNVIEEVTGEFICFRSGMKALYMHRNKLKYLPSFSTNGSCNLMHLSLYGNHIQTVSEHQLRPLQKLEMLNLANNWIREINVCVFPKSIKIIWLHINRIVNVFMDKRACLDSSKSYTLKEIR